MGHRIDRGYQPWIRRRVANLPDSVVFTCDTCNATFREYDLSYACIDCDFDMCESCYASNVPTEELLDFRPPPEERLSERVDNLKEGNHKTGRYNGRRPRYGGKRISKKDYPDPTKYGWKFTGSCEEGRAEFFEKVIDEFAGTVKLNLYYTTGKIKTVLDHPEHGITPLFGRGDVVTPALYRMVLKNPGSHTSVRYQRRLLL